MELLSFSLRFHTKAHMGYNLLIDSQVGYIACEVVSCVTQAVAITVPQTPVRPIFKLLSPTTVCTVCIFFAHVHSLSLLSRTLSFDPPLTETTVDLTGSITLNMF